MAISDKLNLLRSTKAEIKSAIETKGQQVGDAAFSDYPEKILAIETGTPLPQLTNPGSAGDLLSGKQLIGPDGQAITGTMPEVYTPTPKITIGDDGLITAAVTQGAGHTAGGSASATKRQRIQCVQWTGTAISSSSGYLTLQQDTPYPNAKIICIYAKYNSGYYEGAEKADTTGFTYLRFNNDFSEMYNKFDVYTGRSIKDVFRIFLTNTSMTNPFEATPDLRTVTINGAIGAEQFDAHKFVAYGLVLIND